MRLGAFLYWDALLFFKMFVKNRDFKIKKAYFLKKIQINDIILRVLGKKWNKALKYCIHRWILRWYCDRKRIL